MVDEAKPDQAHLMLVESPKGGHNVYKFHNEAFTLEKVLPASMAFPFESGVIELGTRQIPTMAVVEHGTFAGCRMEVRIVGALNYFLTEEQQIRLMAVPTHDWRFTSVKQPEDLNKSVLEDFVHFIEVYHMLDGRDTRIENWCSANEAWELIENIQMRWNHV